MLKKILIPLDGSQLAENALKYALPIAGALQPEVHLLTVCELKDKEHERLCSVYLQKIAEDYTPKLVKAGYKGKIKKATIIGRAAEDTVKFAEEEAVDLILMLSHGRSGIMPWSAGSTATKIMERATRPVLLLRAAATNGEKVAKNPFARILLPLDGSKYGEAAIEVAKTLAGALKSEVLILRVVDTVQRVRTIGGIDRFAYTDTQVKQLEDEAATYLRQVSQLFTDTGIKVQTILKTGDPAAEILKTSEAENVDLVAISSHGKSGITEWVLGSTSRKIINAGKKSLLLVRPLTKM